MTRKTPDKNPWAVGGGLFAGMETGFFFLEESALTFIVCMLLGLGLSLLAASIIPDRSAKS